jgi:5'/3'-nucleotidase SurE
LVVNDDGIQDQGVWALAAGLVELGDIRIYSSDRNHSGAGMSISLRRELNLREASPPSGCRAVAPAFSLDAPPAQVAAIGCTHAFGESGPDAIVSGINTGWNPGRHMFTTSGTVGAARVAIDRGTTGIAVSVASDLRGGYQSVAAATAGLLRGMASHGVLGQPVLINVNVPADHRPDTEVWLTSPSPYTLFASMAPREESRQDGPTTLSVSYGDFFDSPITSGDELDALRAGAVSVCVTEPIDARTLLEEPWPAVARAFMAGGG